MRGEGVSAAAAGRVIKQAAGTGGHWGRLLIVIKRETLGAMFDRFGGINGSAYFVGGFGMTALTANDIVVVPIGSVIGLRLGANLGYVKFTDNPTWNPF